MHPEVKLFHIIQTCRGKEELCRTDIQADRVNARLFRLFSIAEIRRWLSFVRRNGIERRMIFGQLHQYSTGAEIPTDPEPIVSNGLVILTVEIEHSS